MYPNLHRRWIAAALLVSLMPAPFVLAADADNGGKLAQRWCVACHVVAPGQQQASADVPPFKAIAQKPGFDEKQVAFFLLDPHPKMPNMGLTRNEAADLAAYIAKQK
jgi:mono/diheme cytochrome c family protein